MSIRLSYVRFLRGSVQAIKGKLRNKNSQQHYLVTYVSFFFLQYSRAYKNEKHESNILYFQIIFINL